MTPYVGGVGGVGSCSLHSNTLQTPCGSVHGMATSPEQLVVNDIVYELNRHGKWFVNNHGTVMGGGGTPDIITLDHDGTLLAIEAKSPGAKPKINQLRRAVEILASGGRYVVAYGFDYDIVGAKRTAGDGVETVTIGLEVGESEFDAYDTFTSRQRGVVELVAAT